VTDYAAIIEDVLAKEREEAERQGDDSDSKPGDPATDEAIAKAEAALDRTFHESYRALLKTCDGWEYFSWGVSLFSTQQLIDDYEDAEETLSYSEEVPEELQSALIIGANENDATLYMLCDDGSVVRHLYEEEERWPDLGAFLRSRIETLNDMQRWAGEASERTELEWDPEFREEDDAALVEDLKAVWRPTQPKTHTLEFTKEETPAPSDLVARDEDGELTAALDLGFVLFLGFCPTKDEVLETFAAFRETFPFEGTWRWQRADAMSFSAEEETDPDAEPDFELAIDDQGFYGLRIITGPDDEGDEIGAYILNVRGIPPEAIEPEDEDEDEVEDEDEEEEGEYQRRASFVEVLVPPTEDPAKVRALCERLVDILPVRSGWGGWFARVRDRMAEPDPYDTVFEWCRRYFHIAPCYIDGWLGGALERHPGVGWLTVVGKPFLDAIELSTPEGIDVYNGDHANLYRAGELTLGDVHAGDFPHALSNLAQQLEPVSTTSWSKRGHITMGGIWFSTHSTQLPGAFADHHATEAFMRRFVDPGGFLGPTPREQAIELIERLKASLPEDERQEWIDEMEELTGFRDVLHMLFNGAARTKDEPLATEALEHAAKFPDWALAQVYNNLLYFYDRQNRLDDAMALLPVALTTAEESGNSYTFHNAACLLVKAGRLDEAMHCVQRAKHHDYPLMDQIESDDDLAALRERPEWKALF